MADIKTPAETMALGLEFIGIDRHRQQTMSHKSLNEAFNAHYGSSAADLSQIWFDLQTTTIDGLALTALERRQFKMFMAANYFLWTNPKNALLLSSRFDISTRQIHSNNFWKLSLDCRQSTLLRVLTCSIIKSF